MRPTKFCAPLRALDAAYFRGIINYKRNKNGYYLYTQQVTDETVPNFEYLFENGVGLDSHPVEWFDLFFPMRRSKDTHPKATKMDNMTAWLNVKAKMSNAGRGGKYKSFEGFDKDEFMAHLSLYLLHAISPSPKIDFKFKREIEDPVNPIISHLKVS